jgi:hypothetical protein
VVWNNDLEVITGKRHRAHTGEVSVMSGAPYGYRYIRKTKEALAAYSVQSFWESGRWYNT